MVCFSEYVFVSVTKQRTLPGPPKKTYTLEFKEMFSFLIGLQTTKARLLCCKGDL